MVTHAFHQNVQLHSIRIAVKAKLVYSALSCSTNIYNLFPQGRYGEPAVRRAVPLAIALCSISNPQLAVIDVLNKYSHDSDNDVAYNAIFAMGLVGAGTNNARYITH